MTGHELIALIQEAGPDREVIIQKDAEGNGYSPLAGAYTGKYRAETSWYGEVGLEEITPDMKARGYSEEDVFANGQPALVLVPTN